MYVDEDIAKPDWAYTGFPSGNAITGGYTILGGGFTSVYNNTNKKWVGASNLNNTLQDYTWSYPTVGLGGTMMLISTNGTWNVSARGYGVKTLIYKLS